jgi:hypothetical protein
MPTEQAERAWLPPRWMVSSRLVRTPRLVPHHRRPFRAAAPVDDRYGMMRLNTTGRRSGEDRSVILGCFEDGPNLVTMP